MAIIIASTMSDSGKSTVVSGLVKLFSGIPFKAQNMSLNSYPTLDHGEIAFIQAYQAISSGLNPERYMNPVLLKPDGRGIEIVFMGEPLGSFPAGYYYDEFLPRVWVKIKNLIRDEMVVEAAGGIEPNFVEKDITAVRLSRELNIPIILTLDIDRGGAFTSALGAYFTLPPEVRKNLRGFLINKFRGEEKYLEPAIKWLEEKTGMKYMGYLPLFDEPLIMPEDSMNVKDFGEGDIEVSVISYPYMSNFNEFSAFRNSNASVRFVKKPSEISKSDLIILPGSKNTLESLKFLVEKKFLDVIRKKQVLGICGGFQIMGKKIVDPYNVEIKERSVEGLGFLNVETVYEKDKIISITETDAQVNGYEIRRGRIRYVNSQKPLFYITKRGSKEVSEPDGSESNNYLGYSVHGSLFSKGGQKILREKFGIKIYTDSFEEEAKKDIERVSYFISKFLHVDEIRDIYLGK
ncbi:cobyric acid synthase [Stygiolobus caldivivus]|nr:cobyric acid synthase [Stygiolobus caldivivus]